MNSSVRNFFDVDSDRMKKARAATTMAVSSSITSPADVDVAAAFTPAMSRMMRPAMDSPTKTRARAPWRVIR